MKNIILKKINFVDNLKFYNIFILYNFLILLLTIFYVYFLLRIVPDYADKNFNLNVKDLQFFFGPVINNLLENNSASMIHFNIEHYAARSPLVVYFVFLFYKYISTNIFFLFIFKNLIFSSIIILIAKKILKRNSYTFLLVILPLLIPYNSFNYLHIVPEEGFLIQLFIILTLLLFSSFKNKSIYLGITIFIIFFTKASMIYVCLAFSIFYFFLNIKKNFYPLLFLFLANIIWGSYTYTKTNYFAFGANLLSINGHAMNYITNDKFNDIYPKYSLDIIRNEIDDISKNENFTNEWEINEFYKKKAFKFIKNNKLYYFKGVILKLKHFFFNIKKDFQFPNNDNHDKIRFSNIPNKIFFFVFMFVSINSFFRHPEKEFKINTFLLLVLISFYLFPYMVAFLNTRHMSIVHILSQYYLLFYLFDYFKRIKIKNN